MGLLDFLTQPQNYGLLNGSGSDDSTLNAVPGFSMRAPEDPFADLDKKQKDELAKKAAAGAFVNGAAPVPAAGVSGQMAMQPPFGALAPMAPQAPEQPAATVAQAPVPLPQPRPVAAPIGAGSPPIDQTTLPPNATPTQGEGAPVAAAAAPQEPSLLSKIGDKLHDNSNLLIGMGAGFAGAPSIGAGISRGLTGAGAGSQIDVKQNAINQTAVALQKRGLPADVALAAATNPAILQQILPQVFGAKQRKFTQIGEDMMGNKQFGFVDEASGKAYGMDGQPIEHGNGASSLVPTGPDGQPLSGRPLMDHLEKTDPVTAAGIKGLIAGDLNAQGRNLQKLAPLAKLVDPTFDATQYPVRLKTRESYTSGKDFQETQALNTVAGHLGELKQSADKLGNSNIPVWNGVQNWFADHFTGSPPLVKFRNDLVTTSNELAKAYHGGHVSDSAYAAFNKAVNEAQTPAEMKAAIGELGGLLQSKIEAKESGYRSSMASAPLPAEYSAINDKAKKSFQDISDWANGRSQAAAAPVKVSSPAEAAKLPKGTHFIDPNGVERVVP